jgi:hypothetical protein
VQATYHRRANRKLVLSRYQKHLRRNIAWKVGFQPSELIELIKILKEKKENYREEVIRHAYARTFASNIKEKSLKCNREKKKRKTGIANISSALSEEELGIVNQINNRIESRVDEYENDEIEIII